MQPSPALPSPACWQPQPSFWPEPHRVNVLLHLLLSQHRRQVNEALAVEALSVCRADIVGVAPDPTALSPVRQQRRAEMEQGLHIPSFGVWQLRFQREEGDAGVWRLPGALSKEVLKAVLR